MKKLFTLLLVLAGVVSTASATDYILGCNDGSDWYVGGTFTENSDGTYSMIMELPAKNTNFLFTVFEGTSINWDNAYRPNSDGDFNTYDNETLTFKGKSNSGNVLSFPRSSSKARALKIQFNPTTLGCTITRLIVVASGYNNWSTTTDYLSAKTAKSEIYTGDVVLEQFSSEANDGYKYVILNNGSVYWGSKKVDGDNEYIADGYNDSEGWHPYDNATVNADGVYSLTANFNTWAWTDPTRVIVSASLTYDYATFSSEYALDFTGIETVKAYKASMSSGKVLMTRVDGKVPANTGLFIVGETTDVPTTICTTSVGDNLLKATTGEAIYGDNLYSFVKRTVGENVDYGFVKVASGYTWAVGKAYLDTSVTAARELSFFFDEEGTTAISEELKVKNEKLTGDVFNLAGQHVAQPTKGLYIVNGRKVVIK